MDEKNARCGTNGVDYHYHNKRDNWRSLERMRMLSNHDDLFGDFADQFYGYGNYEGRFWFVGMEEGGGNTIDAIEAQLSAWKSRGRRELEDLVTFNADLHEERFFSERATLQPTWNKLIRILLSAEGQDVQREHVRLYQRVSLGRPQGANCLIELLPLPSPSTNHWIYADYSRLPQLISREKYRDYYLPARSKHIQARINQYRPAVVVFYGINPLYRKWWEYITDASFSFDRESEASMAKRDETLFLIVHHPASRGRGNDYFHAIGQRVASELAGQ
jgi:hypothetical protein